MSLLTAIFFNLHWVQECRAAISNTKCCFVIVIMVLPWILFLDASSHLNKRVCPSVRNAFVKIAENRVMQDEDASYVVYTAVFVQELGVF